MEKEMKNTNNLMQDKARSSGSEGKSSHNSSGLGIDDKNGGWGGGGKSQVKITLIIVILILSLTLILAVELIDSSQIINSDPTTNKNLIKITNAEHLDEDRNLIEDVFMSVSERDDVWKLINSGEYLRVTFEKNLTSKNDISVYARGVDLINNKNNNNIINPKLDWNGVSLDEQVGVDGCDESSKTSKSSSTTPESYDASNEIRNLESSSLEETSDIDNLIQDKLSSSVSYGCQAKDDNHNILSLSDINKKET